LVRGGGGPRMTTVGMNYRVRPGKEAVFEAAFARIAGALAATPGHTESRLFRDVAQPDCYLILSDWSDRPAFDAFLRPHAVARAAGWGGEQVLAERPRHTVYER